MSFVWESSHCHAGSHARRIRWGALAVAVAEVVVVIAAVFILVSVADWLGRL